MNIGDPYELTSVIAAPPVVVSPGPAGPTGPPGPAGPQGPPGSDGGGGGETPLIHVQTTPSSSWSIDHAKGRVVSVTLVVDGQIQIADAAVSSTQAALIFPVPTAGTAILI